MTVQPSPENHGRPAWSSILLNALSFVGGVAALLTFFIPGLRDWMKVNGLIGWGGLFLALIIIPVLAHVHVRRRLEAVRQEGQAVARVEVEASIESRLDAARREERSKVEAQAAMRYMQRDKDVALIKEWLGDWTVDSDFFKYLVNEANHNHYPSVVYEDIFDHVDRWSRDHREIVDPQLNATWGSLCEVAWRYWESLAKLLHADERGLQGVSDVVFLRVPVEWKNHPSRSREAYDELDEKRLDFINSLNEMFRLLHRAS